MKMGWGTQRLLRSGILALCVTIWGGLLIGGCSEQTRYNVLSIFFEDVPKPGEGLKWKQVVHAPRRAAPYEPPPKPIVQVSIEKEKYPFNWLPDLLKTLPHDTAGYPDMVLAFNDKKIDPLPGPQEHATALDVLDKPIKMIPGGKLKCIFSHQVHTAWLDCKSCHPALFKEKTGEEIAMSDFDSGKFCGACHGKVAFPIKGECIRCHSGMKKKAAKEPPKEKLVTKPITLARADSKDPSLKQIPPAVFPHLPHRVAYRCYACHDAIFPMKKDAPPTSMLEIDSGRACGVCHNGKVAFGVDFGTCSRCHPGAAT